MPFVTYKKIGNKEYAYQLTSYRDPKTKKVKHTTKYLGAVKDKNKQIFERKYSKPKPEKHILDFGDAYLINKFIQTTPYNNILPRVFKDNTQTLLTLLTYRLSYTAAMMYTQTWYEGNYAKLLYKNANVTSQRISEFLCEVGNEETCQEFFQEHITQICGSQAAVIIDTTSLPNQIHIPLTSWGRSGEQIDKQIRFLIVVDKNTSLPLFFRVLPGNIVDVSSLKNTTAELRHFKVKNSFVCTDAGFFSEDNIRGLFSEKIDFLTRLPASRMLYKELILSEVKTIESPVNGVRYGRRGLFVKQKKVELFGKELFAYVVLDPERKGRETSRLIRQTVDEAGNNEDLEYDFMCRGVMVLVSSFEIPRSEVVPTYYLRQRAEVLFGFAKDDLNLLPLRVHGEETLRGFLFLQFLTLVLFSELRKAIGEERTVEEVLLTMRNLKCKVYDDEIIISELTKEQKAICEKLEIVVPKTLGI